MQVDVESTVGLNAFARIAPALHTVADSITVHSQFDALTANTGGRLPFPIFDKYVAELDKYFPYKSLQCGFFFLSYEYD